MIPLWGFLIERPKLALGMGLSLAETNKAEEYAEAEEEENSLEAYVSEVDEE